MFGDPSFLVDLCVASFCNETPITSLSQSNSHSRHEHGLHSIREIASKVQSSAHVLFFFQARKNNMDTLYCIFSLEGGTKEGREEETKGGRGFSLGATGGEEGWMRNWLSLCLRCVQKANAVFVRDLWRRKNVLDLTFEACRFLCCPWKMYTDFHPKEKLLLLA